LKSGVEASDVEDYFEEEEQQQQASAKDAVTNVGKRSHQLTCAAICVLLTARERAHSVPDVTWACAWCLVSWNITQKEICNISPSL